MNRAERAEYMRNYRAKLKRAGRARLTTPADLPEEETPRLKNPRPPKNPAMALARWSRRNLKVPPGHANAGKPLELPAYAVEFLKEALAPGVREAGCFVARKNAKSAAIAVLILAHLAHNGPLRRLGWRCGVASISRDKAAELWQQAEDICRASSLPGIALGRVPRHVSSPWGRCEFLSADKTAGHASGFNLAVFDEIGLAPERGRALAAGLLSSTSARDGRLIGISVIGDSPLSQELIGGKDDPAVVVHVHAADPDCALDDETAWQTANPTLGSIKSKSYMEDMARRAQHNPNEQSAFRSFDLNQPTAPHRETIVPLDRWTVCAAYELPPRSGPVYVGLDLGATVSLTAASLYWPDTGRLEAYGACGGIPRLVERGEADGVGQRYLRMEERGELRVMGGRTTPVVEFIDWIRELLAGETPVALLADRYRQGEAEDAFTRAGVTWPVEWRGSGAGPHGFADVRSFQKAVYDGRLRPGFNLFLESAIKESVIEPDKVNGNPVLLKRKTNSRIDALSAAILAVGAGERLASEPIQPAVHIGLDGSISQAA